jgi:hypothetical protein
MVVANWTRSPVLTTLPAQNRCRIIVYLDLHHLSSRSVIKSHSKSSLIAATSAFVQHYYGATRDRLKGDGGFITYWLLLLIALQVIVFRSSSKSRNYQVSRPDK